MGDNINDRRIDYVEFPATDIPATKHFYTEVFGWKFEDYGPDYTSFRDGRLAGGFTKAAQVSPAGPLIVIYATDLAGMEGKVKAAREGMVKPIFAFPGGRRFHFTDPNGNESRETIQHFRRSRAKMRASPIVGGVAVSGYFFGLPRCLK
jgi:uncharacterized protein